MVSKKAQEIARRKEAANLEMRIGKIEEFILYLAEKDGYEFVAEVDPLEEVFDTSEIETEIEAVSEPVEDEALKVQGSDKKADSGAENSDSDDSKPDAMSSIMSKLSGKPKIDGND